MLSGQKGCPRGLKGTCIDSQGSTAAGRASWAPPKALNCSGVALGRLAPAARVVRKGERSERPALAPRLPSSGDLAWPRTLLALDSRMEDTACCTSAVSSMTAGVLPAPTPSAGCPDE